MYKAFGIRVGIIICDSVIRPLRSGTTGAALASVGFVYCFYLSIFFSAVENDIGNKDIFGRKLAITSRAIADNLACTAELVMGEGNQRINDFFYYFRDSFCNNS